MLSVDWEALRLIFAGISAAGGAINIARWFGERVEETSEENVSALQSETVSKIERARLRAMASPLPIEANSLPIATLPIFDAIKGRAEEIEEGIKRVINAQGMRPAERRSEILVLNRDYCTMIGSMIDVVPDASIPKDIKETWQQCQARFPDL